MNENGYTLSDIAAVNGNGRNSGAFGEEWIWIIVLFLFAGGWGQNGGFGGNRGGGAADNYVLASDFATIQRQLSDGFSGLERKGDTINNGLCDGFYAQNTTLLNGFSGVNQNLANGFANAELSRANGQTAIISQLNANNIAAMQAQNAIQTQIADCCCQNRYDDLQNTNVLQTAISNGFCQTNFNGANNTRDLIDNQNANTRAILEALNANKVEALKERIAEQAQQISQLNLAASQAAQNSYLLNELRSPGCPVAAYMVPNPNCCHTPCGCGC